MIKILIADDERLMLQGFLHSINWLEHGYEIVGAVENSAKVLEICKLNTPDIAVLDINMPGISGLELIKELKNQYPDMIVIILTAYDSFEFAREAMRLKADEYLLKPEIEYEDLLNVMNRFKETILERKKTEQSSILEEDYYLGIVPQIIVLEQKENAKGAMKDVLTQMEGFIEAGNSNLLKHSLSLLLTEIERIRPSKERVSITLCEAMLLIIRRLNTLEKNIDEITGVINFNPYVQISSFKSFEELKRWYLKLMDILAPQLSGVPEREYRNIIANTLAYVNENYCDENIRLESVAASLYVSYAYLSQLFSQEVGDSFNRYLSRLRIEKAKNLLLNRKLKLHEVAEAVGYKDVSYFIKVFKKYTGVTPYEFRNNKESL